MTHSRRMPGILIVAIIIALTGCRVERSVPMVDEDGAPPPVVDKVVGGLAAPVSLVFLSPQVWLVAERHTGHIRWIEGEKLRKEPFATVEVSPSSAEDTAGLTALAVDPNYPLSPYVYAFYTPAGTTSQRIVRFTVKSGAGVDPQTIVDNLPAGSGRIIFGADGKLYVTLGDIEAHPDLAQKYDALPGKVLRYNPDGTIPADNPIELPQTASTEVAGNDEKTLEGNKTPVYTIGHRHPFGMAVNPENNDLYISDNGPGHDDKLHHLVAGDNYGWPDITGFTDDPRFHAPLWSTGKVTIAPTGMAFYTGNRLPQFANNLFFAASGDGKLRRAIFAGPDKIASVQVVPEAGDHARLDVAMGPDGDLYFTSTDAIYRLHAAEK
ncbi:MAG: PQQ-dependent sugar dehydrogenase [Armatimonadota bacterium]